MPAAPDRRYWLLKTEPGCFSYEDLLASPERTTFWSGVRNFQARNFMRDEMKRGDGVLFYYSGAEPPGIVATAEVVREGYPDFTALDPGDEHFDPRSSEENPVWYMVDIRAGERFRELLPLGDLRHVRALEQMELLRKGSRLSVQPVRAAEWAAVLESGGLSPKRRGRDRDSSGREGPGGAGPGIDVRSRRCILLTSQLFILS